ncbi:unnamed protein product [Heligmosomoides polygyrus]|uniref:Uncharacterized protein n=1 Tax=Heligmosomoides polygyrus TaxID=6339 RepID=A0A183FFY2_HELPZ|nr:unnamed protein product [Heligmosomoides polygyrus]
MCDGDDGDVTPPLSDSDRDRSKYTHVRLDQQRWDCEDGFDPKIEFVLTAGKHEVSKSTGAAAAVVFGGKDLRACAPLTTQLSQRCAVCLSENSVRTTDNLEHEICPSWTRKDTRRERENDGQTS